MDVSIQGFKKRIGDLQDELKASSPKEPHGKNAEVEPESLDKPQAYGHWISPNGEMERVHLYSHDIAAKEILTKHLGVQPENLRGGTDIYKDMYDRGWARGVHEGGNIYHVEKEGELTSKQIRELKNYGIERNQNVQGITGSGGIRQIYTRPDEEGFGKHAEEESKNIGKEIEGQLQEASFAADKEVSKTQKNIREITGGYIQKEDAIADKLSEAIKSKYPNAKPDHHFLLDEVQNINNDPVIEKSYRKKFGDEIIDEIKNDSFQLEQAGNQIEQNLSEADRKATEARNKSRSKTQELESFQHPQQEGLEKPDEGFFGKNSEIFTSTVDRINAAKKDETHNKVARKFRNFFDTADTNYGRFGQAIVRTFQNYTQPEVQNVYRREWEKANSQPFSRRLTANEQRLEANLQPLLQRPVDEVTRLGAKDIPSRFNIIDPDILWKIDNDPTSIDARRSLRQWEDWIVSQGASRQEAKESISDWQKLHRNHGNIEGSKIEQYGLPWELIDKNPARAALSFGRRTGFRLSWLEHMRNDPEMQAALGIKDANGNTPQIGTTPGIDYIGHEKAVEDALKFAYNIQGPLSPKLNAWAQLVGSSVMGPGTAARNIASIPANLAPYDVTMKDFLKGLSGIKEATARAYEQGATRIHPSEYEFLGDVGNPDKTIANLNKLSNFFRKWTGRNASDKFESNLYYSIGEQWAGSQLVKAHNGDTKALDLLKRVTGNETPLNTSIPDIAKGFVNVVRGTYGPQGLPPWAIQGGLAPLSRSINTR